jgi:16S rRNA (cytosine1402-N4)-methyltransferase
MAEPTDPSQAEKPLHRRRPRYPGKNPRRFADKYKEHNPARYAETVAKVLSSGKTPAGSHRPVMVNEVVQVLAPKPGELAIDCTLGFGGHAQELLARLQPGGRLIGLDADPIELPKTEARLRSLGFEPEAFQAVRSNFAGLPQVLAGAGVPGADLLLADLGVSSMQFDDPDRGFSLKLEGPLDMRMNPGRGQPASDFLAKLSAESLAALLAENADEPHARILGPLLAGRRFSTTTALAAAIRSALPRITSDQQDQSIRLVFQALRIVVNDEFSALESLLRLLPTVLNPAGRAAILTFHSGEDRRVKKSFEAGFRAGLYSDISREVMRPSTSERHSNPRSVPAKLRWAIRSSAPTM